ncbi:hypothetical protein GPECTOR_62g900 [Gonium pectorale]|uniref:Uncharacterized protein n=1 Tax=Gonium pectorale TaxID=33097 RepID=A0A150G5H3_GONPE|nr:hypothetical protein GPECTOR_62g900 [Gonium pectorale]|eukprot:KXZ44785.1 hypothetical protein GPECTOR_62g900 [Gonium pectorale]
MLTTAVSSDPPTVETVADAAALLGSAWDPEGLFSKAAGPLNFAAGEQMGDLISRRERERAARLAAAAAAAAAAAPARPQLPLGVRPLRPLPAAFAAAGANGVAPAELPAEVVSELDALLCRDFMPVDLSWPGLRVVHVDPPAITVDGFLTPQQCDRMIAAAEASGRMVASRVGAGNVTSTYGNASSSRRTSNGMMVTPGVAGPDMDAVVAELQARGKQLLRAAEGPAWGSPGKLPRPRQYCYEAIQ